VARRFGNYDDAQGDYIKLWMERKLMNLETFPNEATARPRTMSSFKESRHASKMTNAQPGGQEQFQDFMRTRFAPEPSKTAPAASRLPATPIATQPGASDSVTLGLPSLQQNSLSGSTVDMGAAPFPGNGLAQESLAASSFADEGNMGGGFDWMDEPADAAPKNLFPELNGVDGDGNTSGVYLENSLSSETQQEMASLEMKLAQDDPTAMNRRLAQGSSLESIDSQMPSLVEEESNQLPFMMTPIKAGGDGVRPNTTSAVGRRSSVRARERSELKKSLR
jgi:hypothetical protein